MNVQVYECDDSFQNAFSPVFTKSCDIRTQFYVLVFFLTSRKLPFFFSIYHDTSSVSLLPPWLGLLLPSILALELHRNNYLLWSCYSFCYTVTTTERKQCIVKHVDTKPLSWIKNVTQACQFLPLWCFTKFFNVYVY